jgi:hypothetical protein
MNVLSTELKNLSVYLEMMLRAGTRGVGVNFVFDQVARDDGSKNGGETISN